MDNRQTLNSSISHSLHLPDLWLISDERNDEHLERSLKRLPPGSGFIYRHYHLSDQARIARFIRLARICRALGHVIILADSALTAKEWGADGIYGAPRALYPRRQDMIHLATAHTMADIGAAGRFGADACLLSPVFPTRSHADAKSLGPVRFRLMARHAKMPLIALGGMTPHHAAAMNWPRWAAIDGLS